MANLMLAELNIYGNPKKRVEFINFLKFEKNVPVTTEEIEDDFHETTIECRWNLGVLTEEDTLKKAMELDITFDAKGSEEGVGFFQTVGLDRDGYLTNRTVDLANSYFDYREDD